MTPPRAPGVYVQERHAFPRSVVAVRTGVPAFIGYTARADRDGESCLNTAVRIGSMQDYLACFGARQEAPGGGGAEPAPPSAQYRPVYFPVAVDPGAGDLEVGSSEYSLVPDPGTLYNLYTAVRMFYENGGDTAYVVSVGTYGTPTGRAASVAPEAPTSNPHVHLSDLMGGVDALRRVPRVTMVVVPDATLLPAQDNGTLMQHVLRHCGRMGNRVAILDVPGGATPDPMTWAADIQSFRAATGTEFLSYGIAYYPFLHTTLLWEPDVSFLNVGGGIAALRKLLPDAASEATSRILAQAEAATEPSAVAAAESALRISSPGYARLQTALLAKAGVLPPSGAMAGLITLVDDTQGVWYPPANTSVVGAVGLTLNLGEEQLAGLNVDAVTGKSINAFRFFPGRGAVVWGARTLDGNSPDHAHIAQRRTLIMIEQSVKRALDAYAFEPNSEATWAVVGSTLNGFLAGLWRRGALLGATARDAFSVSVGLGKTMTEADILDGRMIVSIRVALSHPAEFSEITFVQELQAP